MDNFDVLLALVEKLGITPPDQLKSVVTEISRQVNRMVTAAQITTDERVTVNKHLAPILMALDQGMTAAQVRNTANMAMPRLAQLVESIRPQRLTEEEKRRALQEIEARPPMSDQERAAFVESIGFDPDVTFTKPQQVKALVEEIRGIIRAAGPVGYAAVVDAVGVRTATGVRETRRLMYENKIDLSQAENLIGSLLKMNEAALRYAQNQIGSQMLYNFHVALANEAWNVAKKIGGGLAAAGSLLTGALGNLPVLMGVGLAGYVGLRVLANRKKARNELMEAGDYFYATQ